MGKPSRNNHVVTAGYLRYFSQDDDVRYLELDGTLDKVLNVRSILSEKDFSVVKGPARVDDSLERQWGVFEHRALPHLRGLSVGAPLTDPEDAAIKALFALHFARNYGVKALWDTKWPEAMAQHKHDVVRDSELLELFRSDYERDPEPGELEAIAAETVEEARRSNWGWANQQLDGYVRMLDFVWPLRAERGVIRSATRGLHFITSDNPLVFRRGDHVAHPANGIPVEQSEMLLMPLTKNVVVCFASRSDRPAVVELNDDGVRDVNAKVTRAAMRFVVTHPRTDLVASAPWLPQRPVEGQS